MRRQMRPVINKLAAYSKDNNMEGFEGAAVIIVDKNYKFLHDDVALYRLQTHAHSEMVVLHSSDALERYKSTMHKVYLYTLFAPCGNCTDVLKTFPRQYQNTKFSLGFYDYVPKGARYRKEDVDGWLLKLVQYGWKVRQWTSGRYREPEKADSPMAWTPPPGRESAYERHAEQKWLQNNFHQFSNEEFWLFGSLRGN